MKQLFLWLIIAMGPCFAQAQTKINKTYPISKGQSVVLNFDYPKMVKVSTWEGNEIAIEAIVKINNGEADRAFSLQEKNVDGKIFISNKLEMDLIPDNYYIIENGAKVKFDTKKDMELYAAEHSNITSRYQSKDIEITVLVKVPANIPTEVVSTYGTIELLNFNGPVVAEAKYGSVDASLTEKTIGNLKLTTQYGKLYTNLNLQPTEKTQKTFFTSITAHPGNGPSYDLKATYGNIYVRNSIK